MIVATSKGNPYAKKIRTSWLLCASFKTCGDGPPSRTKVCCRFPLYFVVSYFLCLLLLVLSYHNTLGWRIEEEKVTTWRQLFVINFSYKNRHICSPRLVALRDGYAHNFTVFMCCYGDSEYWRHAYWEGDLHACWELVLKLRSCASRNTSNLLRAMAELIAASHRWMRVTERMSLSYGCEWSEEPMRRITTKRLAMSESAWWCSNYRLLALLTGNPGGDLARVAARRGYAHMLQR